MSTYYAIARRSGSWVFICAGNDPEPLYREAIEIIEARESYGDGESYALSPHTESQLDTLRVVPAEIAKEHYHVTFSDRARVKDYEIR